MAKKVVRIGHLTAEQEVEFLAKLEDVRFYAERHGITFAAFINRETTLEVERKDGKTIVEHTSAVASSFANLNNLPVRGGPYLLVAAAIVTESKNHGHDLEAASAAIVTGLEEIAKRAPEGESDYVNVGNNQHEFVPRRKH